MFSTRGRAIIVTAITTLVVFADLLGLLNFRNLGGILATNSLLESIFSALLVSLLVFVGVLWVLFFKVKSYSWFAISLFPSVAIFPYLLIAESSVGSIFSGLEQVPLAVVASCIFAILAYLLILTANVLNGAYFFRIPLGQAGKAAQFISSLISVYFLTVFLLSADVVLPVRAIWIAVFVFYFVFSCLWTTLLPMRQVLLDTFAITILTTLAVVILSIWPISSVYVSLSVVVILYVMFNVALETRENINKMIWVEHGLLILLVLIILFTNAVWGINGSLV